FLGLNPKLLTVLVDQPDFFGPNTVIDNHSLSYGNTPPIFLSGKIKQKGGVKHPAAKLPRILSIVVLQLVSPATLITKARSGCFCFFLSTFTSLCDLKWKVKPF